MRCPRCQVENDAGARFCEDCGARLEAACPSCGTPVTPGKKFCRSCGAALSPEPGARFASPESYTPKHLAEKILTSKAALEGERKQITVLFADLRASTELLADIDPEEARHLLDPVLDHMMEAVHRYEGTVNHVMGDGIMAMFGAPAALEDHAVRACYAALRMQESVARYAEDVRGQARVPILIRVGLNSGEVVVRSIGNDLRTDYSAVGQTTHLAARMEQLAEPGCVYLAPSTARLAVGYVDTEPLGPMTVKGFAEPIEVSRLTGARAARTRVHAALARGLTPFVGRDAEREHVRRALDLAREGRGQIVAVVGEPGVGKSRLLWEIAREAEGRGWALLESGSVSHEKASAYAPVVLLLRGVFGVQEREAPEDVQDRIAARLRALDSRLEAALPAFLTMLDVPFDDAAWEDLAPHQRRQRTLEALRQLLLAEGRARPTLVIFEDLHWLDAETQALLDSLVEGLAEARLGLLVTYRPEYRHEWGARTYYTQLRLDPLAAERADALLDALLGGDLSVAAVKPPLLSRTEGNPLFLEESVRRLEETGALVGRPGNYRLVRPVEGIDLTPTVHAVLAARIDRLPPAEKRLLQAAAVIGKDVPLALLEAIADVPEPELRPGIARLQAGEFLYETQRYPDPEFTFKHAFTQEVAYSELLHEARRGLHAAVGRAIERLHADRLEETYGRLGHHYARAEDAERAVTYLTASADKAARLYAAADMTRVLEEALRLADRLSGDTTATRARIVVKLALALHLLGRLPDSLALLLRHQGLLERIEDPALRGAYSVRLAYTASLLGDFDRADLHARRAIDDGVMAGDRATQGLGHYVLALNGAWLAPSTDGIANARHAIALLDGTPERAFLGMALWNLAFSQFQVGDLEAAGEVLARARVVGTALEDTRLLAFVAWTAAIIHVLAGEPRAAVADAASAGDLAVDPLTSAIVSGVLGFARVAAGDLRGGLPLLEGNVQVLRRFRHIAWSLFMGFLADASLASGEPGRARELAAEALVESRHARFTWAVGWSTRTLGRIARADGTHVDVARHLGEAFEHFTTMGARLEAARTRLDLAELYLAKGERVVARKHLGEARAVFEALRLPRLVEETERLISALGLTGD